MCTSTSLRRGKWRDVFWSIITKMPLPTPWEKARENMGVHTPHRFSISLSLSFSVCPTSSLGVNWCVLACKQITARGTAEGTASSAPPIKHSIAYSPNPAHYKQRNQHTNRSKEKQRQAERQQGAGGGGVAPLATGCLRKDSRFLAQCCCRISRHRSEATSKAVSPSSV